MMQTISQVLQTLTEILKLHLREVEAEILLKGHALTEKSTRRHLLFYNIQVKVIDAKL